MGEPAFLSEEFINNQNPDMELVATSGYGKNGALCVLQRSIRPQVKNLKMKFKRRQILTGNKGQHTLKNYKKHFFF